MTSTPHFSRQTMTRPAPDEDVTGFAERASAVLRELRETNRPDWRTIFEKGLQEAYRTNDMRGLAAIVHYAVQPLDVAGRFAEAIVEIDHVLTMVNGDPDASAMLLGLKAGFCLGTGAVADATIIVREAERALAQATDVYATNRAAWYIAAVRCRAMLPAALPELEAVLARSRSTENGTGFLFLVSWYVPYLFAAGERQRTRAWIRGMRLQAEVTRHHWRSRDAQMFSIADDWAPNPHAITTAVSAGPNWLARLREFILHLRGYVIAQNWDDAHEALRHIKRLRARDPSVDMDAIGAFEACVAAHEGLGTALVSTPLPGPLHLSNLASSLAGAEAVALAGSQALAAAWLDWMSKTLPGNVETSLEWPVSRRRIEALLAVRAGNNRRARRLFEDAIRWTQKEGYTLEHAIAQAQLAELLALTDICLREQVWTDLRTESWATLKTLDVNPLPHCYAVARCISSLKAERHKPELSPREAQVLKALAEGLSYRQTAERLGVHWQTVQTVAHRIYDKLDARGKFRAITIARELGIL